MDRTLSGQDLALSPRMLPACPSCPSSTQPPAEVRTVIRFGHFRRRSDSRRIQRFRCLSCRTCFSRATFHPCYRQNKRQHNEPLRRLLCSGVSQRRAAQLLSLSRTTVVRKFLFLAAQARLVLEQMNATAPMVTEMQFDDMETFEHTKCKPLSITLSVVAGTRRILDFEVSRMPAKGPLAAMALKKYGPRADERAQGRERLFTRLALLLDPYALIKSDQNPHYPGDVKRFWPKCRHKAYLSRRACVVGQGELKKIGFDPIFSLNHTAAKCRADMNRLFRRTWCTTKKPERLTAHLTLYAVYHNQTLQRPSREKIS